LRAASFDDFIFESHPFRIVCLKSLVRGKSEQTDGDDQTI